MNRIIKNIIIASIAAVLIGIIYTDIISIKKENERLKSNQEILLSEKELVAAKGQFYKVSDSLSAAKITELQLTLSEYKKYRKEDLKLIEKLKINKSNLDKVISSQTETINLLSIKLDDTIKVDTITNVIDTLKCFTYKSKWIDVAGIIGKDTVELNIHNRESLKVIEEVKYKRFLGFLWKTNKIKTRHINVISENPSTSIINIDYISVSRKQ